MVLTFGGIFVLLCAIVIFVIRLQIVYTQTIDSKKLFNGLSLDGLVLFPLYFVLGLYILNLGQNLFIASYWIFAIIFMVALIISWIISKTISISAIKKSGSGFSECVASPNGNKIKEIDNNVKEDIAYERIKFGKERQYKREVEVVKEVLRKWDPLKIIGGLAETGFPPVEYDKYAFDILDMLKKGHGKHEIAKHLGFIQTNHLDIRVTEFWNNKISKELILCWENRDRFN